ncbi:MAG: NUDIX domain-containing protein [Thermoguttaceae bacterium]|nr:NUDIX domain-containing protein [Thermoguttaceae bacterium]
MLCHGGKVLARRRPPSVPWGNFWEFPGGRINPGESPGEAALRECREETGISLPNCEFLGKLFQDAPHAKQEVFFFGAEYPGDQTLQIGDWAPGPETQHPMGDYLWIPLEQISLLEWPPVNREMLPAILAWIRSHS